MANYSIRSAPLPATFRGSPQEFFEAMMDRIEVTSDALDFIIQDETPTENRGPWLKGGNKWYVWSTKETPSGSYVPIDITDSFNEELIVAKEDPDAKGTPYGISAFGDLPPRVWVQLNTGESAVEALWYNFGGSLGWQRGPESLSHWSVANIPAKSLELGKLKSTANPGSVVVASDSGGFVTKSVAIMSTPDPTPDEAGFSVAVNKDGTGLEYQAPEDGHFRAVGKQVVNAVITNNSDIGTPPATPGGGPLASITYYPKSDAGMLKVSFNGWFRALARTPDVTSEEGQGPRAVNHLYTEPLLGTVALWAGDQRLSTVGATYDAGTAKRDVTTSNTLTTWWVPVKLSGEVAFVGAGAVVVSIYANLNSNSDDYNRLAMLGAPEYGPSMFVVEEVGVSL